MNTQTAEPSGPTTIAFGACCHEGRPQPVWDAIVAADPDLFIFAGDNIYGDTEDMAVLQAKYDQLAAVPGFQRLRQACPIQAVYDDHDYGQNDAGREYPMRKESAAMCLDFFGVPEGDPRREHPGIYGSTIMGAPGQRVQIILLDTRYFRDPIDAGTLSAEERREANVVGWYKPVFQPARPLNPAEVERVHRDIITRIRRVLERHDLNPIALGLPPRPGDKASPEQHDSPEYS